MQLKSLSLLLIMANFAVLPAISMERAIGVGNNKQEFYAREIQLDQLELVADQLQKRMVDMEDCGKDGGVFDTATEQCMQFVVVNQRVEGLLHPASTPVNGGGWVLAAAINLFEEYPTFSMGQEIVIDITALSCSFGGTGSWRIETLAPTTSFDQARQLVHRSGGWRKPTRTGYVRVTYNHNTGIISIYGSESRNGCNLGDVTLSYNYSRVSTQVVPTASSYPTEATGNSILHSVGND